MPSAAVAVDIFDVFVVVVVLAVVAVVAVVFAVVDATAPRRRPWRANAMTSELQLDIMMMMMTMKMTMVVRWKGATEDDCGNGGPWAWSPGRSTILYLPR